MAACLVTVVGTGELKLTYVISATTYNIETGAGTFYIESTATAVTYTTLSGTATASSGCLTITALPATCYKISWKGIQTDGYQLNRVSLGVTNITIPDTLFPNSGLAIAGNINGLNDDRVKVVGYKIVSPFTSATDLTKEWYYIVRVLGPDIPIFRIRNSDSTDNIYVYGVAASCTLAAGYTAVDLCDADIIAP